MKKQLSHKATLEKLKMLKAIDEDLTQNYKNLLARLEKEYPSTPIITAYIQVDIIETKLNALKALEYHYRDNGLHGRDKKKYPKELTTAHTTLKLLGENWDKKNAYSRLVLKEKFDPSGTVAERNQKKNRP